MKRLISASLLLLAMVFETVLSHATDTGSPRVLYIERCEILNEGYPGVGLRLSWTSGGVGQFLIQYAENAMGPWINLASVEAYKSPARRFNVSVMEWPVTSTGDRIVPLFVRVIRPPT